MSSASENQYRFFLSNNDHSRGCVSQDAVLETVEAEMFCDTGVILIVSEHKTKQDIIDTLDGLKTLVKLAEI